jgi:hypothetical protein
MPDPGRDAHFGQACACCGYHPQATRHNVGVMAISCEFPHERPR